MKDNKFYVSGVVDTIPYPGEISFLSFQYPSSIPQTVQDEMARIAERFLQHIMFDNAALNIEFFWDPVQDTIRLIELNPRVASNHAFLFEQVDGMSNYQAELNLILGYEPILQPKKALDSANVAAMLFYRVDDDAYVEEVPNEKDLIEIAAKLTPGALIVTLPEKKHLSEFKGQDCYKYLVWYVFLVAESEEVLYETYQTCIELINPKIELRPCN